VNDIERQLIELREQVRELKQPKRNRLDDFLSRFERLKRLSAESRAAQPQISFRNDKPQVRVYADSSNVVALALRGYDFVSRDALLRFRREFADFLQRQLKYSRDAAKVEADRIDHSWDAISFAYDPPHDGPCAYLQHGRGFLCAHAPKTLQLDISKNSIGLKLYRHAQEIKNSHDHHGMKWINYRRHDD
jgi:hypothetical protein